MTAADWERVKALLFVNWPHQLPPEEALAKWGRDLAEEPVAEVLVAVETLYREGREFPPNGAQILAKLAELKRDDPDPGEAWAIVTSTANPHHLHYEQARWLEWVAERSEAAAEAARRFGLESFALRQVADETTTRAQFRRIYEGVLADRRRTDVRQGLEASIRRLGGPQRPDYLELVSGERRKHRR